MESDLQNRREAAIHGRRGLAAELINHLQRLDGIRANHPYLRRAEPATGSAWWVLRQHLDRMKATGR